MSRGVRLANDEYERTFMRWQYTPRWRLAARLIRRLEWKVWLRALMAEVKREAA